MSEGMDDFGVNVAFVEELRERAERDPAAVDPSWRRYFDGADGASAGERLASLLQERVAHLIDAYRTRGHALADLDPLDLQPRPLTAFTLEEFGLADSDLDRVFATEDLAGPPTATLREIVARLQETYCRTIGVEIGHLDEPRLRRWLQERMEATQNHLVLTRADQLRLLTKLTDAELFEQFIHTKYVGAKRFSLEGAESLIPLCDELVETAGRDGVEEIVIGMAHRGRLNVLAHILDKNLREIFAEFDDANPELYIGRGDVKYHLGYSSSRRTAAGAAVHLSLTFNPSHLAWISGVVEGRVRAKQDRRGDAARRRVMPLLIHGDAAFAGQGIIAEVLNLSELEGYRTGGTVHVILNNQIGFTTVPRDARSTPYATDVARMLRIPIFHVNGEDPEAVAQVVRLACDFRQEFGKDVVIDLYCYRKYGHNEGDEPRFTQPVMYKVIDRKPSVREVYVRRLADKGEVTAGEADALAHARREALEQALAESRAGSFRVESSAMAGLWAQYRGGLDAEVPEVDTGVPAENLRALMDLMTTVPPGFTPNPKIERLLEQRREMGRGTRPLDWGGAEALAFASLVWDGAPLRLSGQDSRRGTFSHRHSVLYDAETGTPWVPVDAVAAAAAAAFPGRKPGRFEPWDSPLSEGAVLGFDYGYSLDYPEALVIWEAQFGDFANAAQVVIDQFISSAEDKWRRLSSLVLLLPHGFEGQGPEHSSARLERFLQLGAEDNMLVVNLTTPAQIFHALRRQVLRPYRKPLVVMSPKSLLRHKAAVSSLDDLARGAFRRVQLDEGGGDPAQVTRVLLCSGKLYFELADERARRGAGAAHVAILRLPQMYPLPEAELARALAPYRDGTPLVWVQEEPWNMGAWFFLRGRLPASLTDRLPLRAVTRPESASPATGSQASHKIEQAGLIAEAFA
ncbi:MAG TPA: 2-oxoglutarate dehydrogenase E1 component [Myxococcota bacterium]|jgi:2-oxoglutarate dehydrogenase E1 component|nr:2-oxoglutarate dehydrogenase E1 component [Myxococcota bacterium]